MIRLHTLMYTLLKDLNWMRVRLSVSHLLCLPKRPPGEDTLHHQHLYCPVRAVDVWGERSQHRKLDVFKPQQQYFRECIAATPTKCQHVSFQVLCWLMLGCTFISAFATNCRTDSCIFRGRYCTKAIFFRPLSLQCCPSDLCRTPRSLHNSFSEASFHCTTVFCLPCLSSQASRVRISQLHRKHWDSPAKGL